MGAKPQHSSRLSDRYISSQGRPDKPIEIYDERERGLVLRARPSGHMSFWFYLDRGHRKIKIGEWPLWSVAQAREKAAKLRDNPDPLSIPQESATLAEFVRDQYRPWYVARHKDKRLHNLSMILREFGEDRLTEITTAAVDDWRTERLRQGRQPSTINRQVHALQGCLSHAVERGLLPENPLFKLKALRVEQDHRVRYLDEDEERRLRASLLARSNEPRGDYLSAMVLLTMNTGLRQGELFSLTWDNVAEDRITVRANTAKGYKTRHIPPNKEARAVLERWRPDNADGFVFKSANGERFDNVKRSWRSLMHDARITDFRFHDLRHRT